MAGALPLGQNKHLGDVFREQSKTLMTNLDFPTITRIEFLKNLLLLVSKQMAWDVKCHLTGPTGTNAVEGALKLARWKTKNPTILYLEGSYHGMTGHASSVSDIKSPSNLPTNDIRLSRCIKFPKSNQQINECITTIENIIKDCNANKYPAAALILEAIQGEGGVRPIPKEFFVQLKKILKKTDILLIVDEIQTGFGRTGALFAINHYDIIPDILVFSKAASGIGAPLAGFLFSKELDGWPLGSHTGTFRGFTPAFASGLEFIQLLDKTNLINEIYQKGEYFKSHLESEISKHSIVGEIRGKGLLIGIDIINATMPDPIAAERILKMLFKNGLITELGGIHSNTIRLLPALNITFNLIDQAVEIISKTLTAYDPS